MYVLVYCLVTSPPLVCTEKCLRVRLVSILMSSCVTVSVHSYLHRSVPAVALSELPTTDPAHEYEALKFQDEGTYEQVDQPHPRGDYQITPCVAYAPTTAAT